MASFACPGIRELVPAGVRPRQNVFTQPRPEAVIGRIEIPQRSSLLPHRSVCYRSGRKHGTENSETPRVHHASQQRGGFVAARGARAAGGNAGDWIFSTAGLLPNDPILSPLGVVSLRRR